MPLKETSELFSKLNVLFYNNVWPFWLFQLSPTFDTANLSFELFQWCVLYHIVVLIFICSADSWYWDLFLCLLNICRYSLEMSKSLLIFVGLFLLDKMNTILFQAHELQLFSSSFSLFSHFFNGVTSAEIFNCDEAQLRNN